MKHQVVFEKSGLKRKERRELERLVKHRASEEHDVVQAGDDGIPKAASMLASIDSWIPKIRPPYHVGTGFEFAAANSFASADIHEVLGPIVGLELLSGGQLLTFDPWEMYRRELVSSPNLLIQGALRRGKSFFVKRLIALMALYGKYAINTSDSKGEHGSLAEAIGGEVFHVGAFGSDVRLNCLESGERHAGEKEQEHRVRSLAARQLVLQQIARLLLDEALTVREKAVLNWALDEVIRETNDRPTIRMLVRKLSPESLGTQGRFEPDDAHRLLDAFDTIITGELRGMFDEESSVRLNPDSPYTVIDTFAMAARGDLALAITQTISNSWVQNTISNKSSGRQYLLVREEGWRDMNSLEALEAHRLQLKLSGEFGITMVMIVHEDGDFQAVGPIGSKEREIAEQLLRGYANVISFYQKPKTLRAAIANDSFTEGEARWIGNLRRGEFLLKTDHASYVVDGNVTTTDWERRLFNTDQSMAAREEGVSV